MSGKFLLGRLVENGPFAVRIPKPGNSVSDAPNDDNHILHENSQFMVPAASGNIFVAANGGTAQIANPVAPTIPFMRFYGIEPDDGSYYSASNGLFVRNAVSNDFSHLVFVNEYSRDLIVHYYIFKEPFGIPV